MVATPRYHGDKPLTYQSEDSLEVGCIVVVPLQRQQVLGVIRAKMSAKPSFATKAITKTAGSKTLPPQTLQLINWLKGYYPAPLGSLMQLVLPSGLLQTSQRPYVISTKKHSPAPPLTSEQKQIIDQIDKLPPQSLLLHGDTGTGKTRVYIELAEQQIKKGNSVIVLTPEIGLTPQLAVGFEKVFGSAVVVLHSNLTPAERRNRWLYVLESSAPVIVVGPRSALFAPVHELGLIVVDEAHDTAYKQEQQPYYQTSLVAATLGKLWGARVVLGSATPSVSDYFAFSEKKLPILRMKESAISHSFELQLSLVEISDRTKFTRSAYLSEDLIKSIAITKERGEQSLIFLNRRGTARLILCEQCGWTAQCPNCDISLTYHGDKHQMHCHVCNHTESAPTKCPDCGHTDIAFKSIGTKTLVAELERLFPEATIKRFDTDLKKHERMEEIYESVRSGDVDILVGTQMLAKGLDLPKLSLVGIVVADTSLFIPDFTAEEHTYQLLSQIIGRVGRGHRHGSVIIQTYHPDHTALQSAIQRNYAAFYEKQIKERKQFKFPPFSYLLKLTVSRSSTKAAETAAQKVVQILRSLQLPIEIIGPSPSFYQKTHSKYHWQIIVKARDRKHLLTAIVRLPANISYDIDPVSLI